MTKKKKAEAKNIFNKYLKEFLSFLLSLLEEGTGDLIRKFGDIINFKKRLQHYILSVIILIASLVVVLYGTGSFLGSFFPNWYPGISHILVGIIFILVAWAYKKYG